VNCELLTNYSALLGQFHWVFVIAKAMIYSVSGLQESLEGKGTAFNHANCCHHSGSISPSFPGKRKGK